MKTDSRIFLAILSLLALSSCSQNFPAHVTTTPTSKHVEPLEAMERPHHETALLPAPPRENDELIPISLVGIGTEQEITGFLALYDNPRTNRPVDYIELYDPDGNLLLIEWIDKFGITRTAVDQGLLEEGGPNLQGVLVLLLEGTPT